MTKQQSEAKATEQRTEIEKGRTIAVLGQNDKGWTTEFGVNKVNGYNHYEFRGWGPNGEPGKCYAPLKKDYLEPLNKALAKAIGGQFDKTYPVKDKNGNEIGEKFLHRSLARQTEPGGPYADVRYQAKDGEQPQFIIRDYNPNRQEKYRSIALDMNQMCTLHECLTAELLKYKEATAEEEQEGSVSRNIITKGPILSTNEKTGWKLEVNEISWNGQEPKLDLRQWSPDHEKCGKGITLSLAQGAVLGIFANQLLNRDHVAAQNLDQEALAPEEAF